MKTNQKKYTYPQSIVFVFGMMTAVMTQADTHNTEQHETKHTQTQAEEHREHGAHDHGAGTLSVATTGAEIAIELASPAYNIIGFGHQPTTAEQQKRVNDALLQLNQGSGLFAPNTQANCNFQSASVESPFKHAEIEHMESQARADDEHDEHEKEHDEHEKEHDEHDSDHEDEQKHADFKVSYTLNCAEPQSIELLDVAGLFQQFPNFEHLKVQWVSDTQQSAVELDHDNTVVRFQ